MKQQKEPQRPKQTHKKKTVKQKYPKEQNKRNAHKHGVCSLLACWLTIPGHEACPGDIHSDVVLEKTDFTCPNTYQL